MTDTPQYEHDCDSCTFLGSFTTTDRTAGGVEHPYDLYVCGNTIDMTLLARASSEPSDYGSGFLFGWMWQAIPESKYGEAFRRARERGLIPDAVLEYHADHYGDRVYSAVEYELLLICGRGK